MPLYASPLPILGSYTFAQMKALTGMPDGVMVFVTNYPANKGSMWRYNATLTDWFPMAPCKVYENLNTITGVAQLADQVLLAIPVEAGLLANKVFRLYGAAGKNGTTDASGTMTIRMGTGASGGLADAPIGSAAAAMAAGHQSYGFDSWNRMATNTSVQRLGGPSVSAFSNATSTLGLNGATAVANVATQGTFVTITTTMPGTTNAPQLGYVALEIQP